MPKVPGLVKRIGRGAENYFLGIREYINTRSHDNLDILIGKSALTVLTILGSATIVSGIIYPAPLKYEWGATTVALSEAFRTSLKSRENYDNKKP